ncbi:hypothetical protein [Nonomuraea jabiensis]|uniref:hypothetical protein n=1 Tax=Nonomuraea jabiensis TaxID=882448 RepID=UPI003D74A906
MKAHLQRAITLENEYIVLEPEVLALAAEALNEAVPIAPGPRLDVANVQVDTVADIALIHVIRCQALAGEPAEQYEYTAAAALSTLVALVDADRVAPQLREVVDHALEQGAPTEVAPAALWALDTYAALLEGDISRTASPDILEAAIMMRQRVVDVMPPDHPGYAAARTDVAMLHVRRYDMNGQVEDLDYAIELLQQAITHAQQVDQRVEAQRLLEIVRDHRASLVRDET